MIRNIIILILILGFVGIVIFLDVPEAQEALYLREQIEEEKKLFSEKQTLLAKVERLREDYKENEESLKKVDYILPSGQDIPNLIVQLEALALEGGLILEHVDFSEYKGETVSKAEKARSQEQKEAKDYKVLIIDLKLTGSYSALKKFLKALEENIRLIDINSIGFSGQLIGGETLFFNFNLNLKTYYQ